VAEDHKERIDRELIELLNEIRVALPGAQVLFAFLLTLPFTERFGTLSLADRDAYFAAFICTAVGTSMLMAPTMHHRLRFRDHDKEPMLLGFNKLILGGSVFLAAAIALSVYVVAGMLFKATWAAVVGAAIAAWLVGLWFVLPQLQRRGRERD
jgi:predicted Co/Zn/Cd cation transporter (cation efflux family)